MFEFIVFQMIVNILSYALKLCCGLLLQVYSKVEEIKRLQRDAYNFQPVLELQNYFTQYRLTSDDELHSLAHELEPKMVVHRRAPRSRSSTNLSSTTPNFSFFKPNSKYLSTTTLRT